jgi:ribonucleoside-triphosphate reductase
MSVKIIKKNNTVQEFNSEKIINAVRKSADRACTRLTNEQENAIVDYVLNYLKLNNIDAIEVNKLHNIVENALESVDSKAAKCYRNYRNYKTTFAEMIDHVYRKKLELSETRDNSNANADSSLVTTQKAITYSELNGELYKRFFLTDEERQAMQDGYIYIHDRGARLDSTNCSLLNVKNIFKGGFKMGNIDYREPRTIGTAISLMTDIMLNAGAAQYGGLTVSNVDSVLAQYAENSYNDYYNEYIENYSSLCNNVNNEKLHQLADKYAIDKVRKEIRDGFIEIECRLNSTTTARGDFIFSSISFGLDTTRFGSLISSEILNVRKNSLGTKTGIPVLFPKLTFMYDENLHGEGKQLEWLFLEAVDCTMRAQYPDFLSMDGGKPAYKITYKDGTSEIVDEKTYKEIIGK